MGTELGEITPHGREKNPIGAYLSANLVMRAYEVFDALVAAGRDDLAHQFYREFHELAGQYAVMIANPVTASLIGEATQDQI